MFGNIKSHIFLPQNEPMIQVILIYTQRYKLTYGWRMILSCNLSFSSWNEQVTSPNNLL